MINTIQWFTRSKDNIKDSDISTEYNIKVDMAENTNSTITTKNYNNIPNGSLIVVKMLGNNVPFFVGIVTGYDNKIITIAGITKIFDGYWFASISSGESSESDFINKLNKNNNAYKLYNYANFINSTNTKWSHIQDLTERYIPISLYDWFDEMFKKYRIAPHIVSFNPENYVPTIDLSVSNNEYQFSDNTPYLIDWNLTVVPGQADKNVIDIVYRSKPNEIHRYYRDINNNITDSSTISNVRQPETFAEMYVIEDLTDGDTPEDLPVPKEIANDKLLVSVYSHDISFSVNINDVIFDKKIINDLGAMVVIKYKNKIYNSVFSGYELNASSNTIKLKFGNNRSTIPGLIRRMVNNK